MRPSTVSTSTKLLLVIAVVTLLAGVAAANVGGAIYTTTSTGTTVNGNIYASKADVYLNGGPQNTKDPGLVPDGTYYFQVTDPSGAVLLSLDDISCRQVVVTGGRIVGVPPGAAPATCVDGYHNLGTFDAANGEMPVQLCNPNASKCGTDFADTPNPGGEYKAWLTLVANYGEGCTGPSHVSYGFCDADSKTDNFKIRKANAAYIVVCKFNDLDGSGTQDSGEPLIPFWPINGSGVDTLTGPLGTVHSETDETGCVSFSVSTFPNSDNTDTATLTETLLTGWQETAPLPGTYDSNGSLLPAGSPGPTLVSGFAETITVKAGDTVTAPNFGNTCVNFDPVNGCGGNSIQLNVTKNANPMLTRTYTWGITKSVDNTSLFSAGGGPATANYTVSVTHDNGTDSGWQVTGTIKVSNPSLVDVTGVSVTDAVDNGGTCPITYGPNGDGTGLTIPAGSEVDVPYTCTYSALPANGTNTATALSPDGSFSGTASIDFSLAAVKVVDGSVTVTDTLGGTLGTVSYTDPSPTSFKYSQTFTDKAGTCTSHQNTATFTTNTTSTTGNSNTVTVTDCQGADLMVTKTATAALSSNIAKKVDKTSVQQSGGNVTFNYTVTVTESAWTVSGNITVTNPNDWEGITATVGDGLTDAGGVCTVNGGSNTVTVALSSSSVLPYTCTFAARPTAVSGTNTATATWNAATAHTPDGSATGTAGYTFTTLTVMDNVQSSAHPSGCNATLGTVSVTTTTPSATPGCGVLSLTSPSWGVFTYSITDANSSAGTCSSYNNTASIPGSSASVTVTVCNTGTGALTMGFWKNTNGAKIIGSYCGGTSGTSLMAYLNNFNPFKDDTVTTCTKEASYVAGVIGGATCSSGGACNTMLRAQMLATALDVYFSDPTLGGNRIGAYNGLGTKTPVIGGIAIDLSHLCSMADSSSGSTCTGKYEDARPEFGILAPCLGTTVGNMLFYSDVLSGVNGSPVSTANTGATWYNQNKSRQVFAKDGFDNINNQIANITTTSCSPGF